MPDKISLQGIIEGVLDDKGVAYEATNDSNVRTLRRAFNRLIERLGGDKEMLQKGGSFEFHESEVPFMKVVIGQLYDGRGLIAQFTNERNLNMNFSSKDVSELIRSLVKEADKDGASKEELNEMVYFFSNIFLFSPLRSLESCHMLIDILAKNLQDLPTSEQSIYMGKVEHILKKELALRLAESILNSLNIAEMIDCSKDIADDDSGTQFYYERNPEIQHEYIQRDKLVLEKIQDDDDLRLYIEKKLGQKAEEIFNYASLAGKSK
jgi:hypothetical protein